MSDLSASAAPASELMETHAARPGPRAAPSLVQVPSEVTSLLSALPPNQRQVLLRLSNGASVANAAFGCGVCRMTVYRWIKKPGPFRTAYDLWRRELIESSQTRLLQRLDDAVDAIQNAVVDGKVDVAMELLKTMGALRKPKLKRGAKESGAVPSGAHAEASGETKHTSRDEMRLDETPPAK